MSILYSKPHTGSISNSRDNNQLSEMHSMGLAQGVVSVSEVVALLIHVGYYLPKWALLCIARGSVT